MRSAAFIALIGVLLAASRPAAGQDETPPVIPVEGGTSEVAPVGAPDEPVTTQSAADSPARAKMYEAMLNVQDGKPEEAIPKLEWVIETDPTLVGAWETLGYAYWQLGRVNEAKALWERWKTVAPDAPQPHRLLAQVSVAEKDLDTAEALYRKSLELNPDHFDTRFGFARVLLWNGKFQAALDELRKLYELDPERLDVELQLARALFASEEYEEALDHWNHINEMVPDNPPYMVARAQALVLVGALKEAQAEAEHVLDIEPDNLAALNLLTDIALRARKNEEVVKAMRRVRDLAESDPAKANIARRLAYFMLSEWEQDPANFSLDQCVQAAQDAYRLDPGDVDGHLFYAEIMTIDKDYGRAEEHFKEILEQDNPHNQRALHGLFQTYLGRMMLDDAERQLRTNLRLYDPHDPYRHYFWAQLYFARGRYRDALESLERLEQEGAQGAIATLLYHGLSSSEWTAQPSVRQFRDHLMTLKRAGFRFLTPDQFSTYFESCPKPERVQRRPLLYRMMRAIRNAWTGETDPAPPMLSDVRPDRVACVTFDDGLRATFRWATPVAEELRIPMTMFIPVGNILNNDIHIV
ncbi:MAG: tetratricopeptide repeat protein, partial [Verrucomicrobia bacterium]|nr:tetratricopeptide repeat protein [Verrucomicrobiota bacterium]